MPGRDLRGLKTWTSRWTGPMAGLQPPPPQPPSLAHVSILDVARFVPSSLDAPFDCEIRRRRVDELLRLRPNGEHQPGWTARDAGCTGVHPGRLGNPARPREAPPRTIQPWPGRRTVELPPERTGTPNGTRSDDLQTAS